MSKLESRELKSKRPTTTVISKLNDDTGEYEIQENFLPKTDLHEYVKYVSKVCGTWDRYNGLYKAMLDYPDVFYPDRIETKGIDKTKEINANFEVIEEKPEQKLLTEGKQ